MKSFSLMIALVLPTFVTGQAQMVSFVSGEPKLITSDNTVEALLTFEVNSGYYIQADSNQIMNPNFIPTRLLLEPMEGITICETSFSKPTIKTIGGGELVCAFEDIFTVRIVMEAHKTFRPGNYPIKGGLLYQACDSSKCYFPKILEFETPMEVIIP